MAIHIFVHPGLVASHLTIILCTYSGVYGLKIYPRSSLKSGADTHNERHIPNTT
jgi:hypothetical protein